MFQGREISKVFAFAMVSLFVLSGCVSTSENGETGLDYSLFIESQPRSILILPPINNSLEVLAPHAVVSQINEPVAEAGYYVVPTALMYQLFHSNGMTVAQDIHNLPVSKLRDIFGADAALYLSIEDYGTRYLVVSSHSRVDVRGTLVDLRTGQVIWQSNASANSSEFKAEDTSLMGHLISAVVDQITENLSDKSFDMAAIAAKRLVLPSSERGFIYGPRSPKFGEPPASSN